MQQIIDKGAKLSDCELYRYLLWREFKIGTGILTFIMLNPSTADDKIDDPTIKKCITISTKLGFKRLNVVNLFAYRATKPQDLKKAKDPIGQENDKEIIQTCKESAKIVCAWGNDGKYLNRGLLIQGQLQNEKYELFCLKINKDGSPKHPLYCDANNPLIPYHTTRNFTSS